jgi:multiple sugar transport system ATP-binding protein
LTLERSVEARTDEILTFGVRPEHLVVGGGKASLGDASIQLVEHLGGSTVVYTNTADGQSSTVLLDGQRTIRSGETIPLGFDPTQTHLFGDDGRKVW